jgi:hypothetical protein
LWEGWQEREANLFSVKMAEKERKKAGFSQDPEKKRGVMWGRR